MVSQQETQRPLLTPGEIMQLPADHSILQVSGTPPILAGKLRYYEDRNFTKRVGELDEPEGAMDRAEDVGCWAGHVRAVHESLGAGRDDEQDRQAVAREEAGEVERDVGTDDTAPIGGTDHRPQSAAEVLRQARFVALSQNERE